MSIFIYLVLPPYTEIAFSFCRHYYLEYNSEEKQNYQFIRSDFRVSVARLFPV